MSENISPLTCLKLKDLSPFVMDYSLGSQLHMKCLAQNQKALVAQKQLWMNNYPQFHWIFGLISLIQKTMKFLFLHVWELYLAHTNIKCYVPLFKVFWARAKHSKIKQILILSIIYIYIHKYIVYCVWVCPI